MNTCEGLRWRVKWMLKMGKQFTEKQSIKNVDTNFVLCRTEKATCTTSR